MTIGDVQASSSTPRSSRMPLTQLASMCNVLQSGVASAERVFELLDAEEQSRPEPPTPTRPGAGRVEFEHVSFSYDPTSR
jgi:ATP-binding cassette subfamily B protein